MRWSWQTVQQAAKVQRGRAEGVVFGIGRHHARRVGALAPGVDPCQAAVARATRRPRLIAPIHDWPGGEPLSGFPTPPRQVSWVTSSSGDHQDGWILRSRTPKNVGDDVYLAQGGALGDMRINRRTAKPRGVFEAGSSTSCFNRGTASACQPKPAAASTAGAHAKHQAARQPPIERFERPSEVREQSEGGGPGHGGWRPRGRSSSERISINKCNSWFWRCW